jgi:trans-aconitate methyltransferase
MEKHSAGQASAAEDRSERKVMSDTSRKTALATGTNFDAVHADYLRANFEPSEEVFRWLLTTSGLARHKSALEIGCGGGKLTSFAADEFDRVIGVDLSKKMIGIAAETHRASNIEWIVADITSYRPRSDIDFIFAYETFHLLPRDAEFIERLLGWLSGRGVLSVSWCAYHWERTLSEPISRVFSEFGLTLQPDGYEACDDLGDVALEVPIKRASYTLQRHSQTTIERISDYLSTISVAVALSGDERRKLRERLKRELYAHVLSSSLAGLDTFHVVVLRQ